MTRILLTGGAGYVGSHTYLNLVEAGYQVAIVDNFSNSSPEVLARLTELSGQSTTFFEADIRDAGALGTVLDTFQPEAVIHFAGLKSVTESVADPLSYYNTNVTGTQVLLTQMGQRGIKKIIFSSSAAVYGPPVALPITTDHPTQPISPYGKSKLMAEIVMQDLVASDPDWSVILLRYFNPVGAHPTGRIGESPNGIPNNLMPYVAMVAAGTLPELSVFGDDFDTRDGTGIRDYIHVRDLASGHMAALGALVPGQALIYNLGTGSGQSVLDVVQAYSQAVGKPVPYAIKGRRPGDVDTVYADVSESEKTLGWRAVHSLDAMCRDSWNWQRQNPRGYE